MRLNDILKGIEHNTKLTDCDCLDVKNNSRLIEKGDIYVAIQGVNVDGHKYVGSALENGAVAVVVSHDMGLEEQIVVEDTKKAYALLCGNLFGNPADKLKLVGVTGTNGKTSVTTIVKKVLEDKGYKTGLIGTIQIEYGDVVKDNPNTTPDAHMFQETLKEMLDSGCEYVVSEVSSHALSQDRIYGVNFETCAFTNLTQDHLDYHKDMEDYFEAKVKLFSMGKTNVVNVHDAYGNRLAEKLKLENKNVTTFSISNSDVTLFANNIKATPSSVAFDLTVDGKDVYPIVFAIPGLYSVENALTAVGISFALGIDINSIVKTLGEINGIKGRCEIIYSDKKMTVICDYAHTPDGIDNILSSIKEVSNGRVVALFGCGGDRDTTKRPLMAKSCEKFADFVIATSDNPRSEDPERILDDVVAGFSEKANYVRIADRTKAIEYAILNAQQDDMIVLLGKGHETYQIFKDKTIHFDEREVVKEITEKMA